MLSAAAHSHPRLAPQGKRTAKAMIRLDSFDLSTDF
jgi:hypothetical protein